MIDSIPIKFMRMVWNAAKCVPDFSWKRLNNSMRKALELSIGSGMEWTVEDMKRLDEFSACKWIGSSHEWCYSLAVVVGNTKSAQAYEDYINREAILADDVDCVDGCGFIHGSMNICRQRERLHVGCSLPWKGEKVFVNSFTGSTANACSYKPDDRGYSGGRSGKINKRYRITRDSVIAERAGQKERAKWTKVFKDYISVTINRDYWIKKINKELGVESEREYAVLGLKKIRLVGEKFQKFLDQKAKKEVVK